MAAATTDKKAQVKSWVTAGVDAEGKKFRNKKVVAPTQAAAVAALRSEGFLPTDVKESTAAAMNINIGPTGVKFKYAARAEFARKMYQMLRAGISPARALQSIAEDEKPAVAAMCLEMAEMVASGKQLSVALAEHPRAFDDVFVAYVASGEESGTLTPTMGRLAILLAKRAGMASKIKGVMAYPKMVGGAILVLVFGIITFLVPTYATIYASFNAKLPAPTLAVVWASDHMMPLSFKSISDPFPFIIPIPQPFNILSIVGYLVIGWIVFRKQTKDNLEVGRRLDMIKFRLPVMGKLWHKSSLFQWSSTLSGALAAGVPWGRALNLAAASSGSQWQVLVARDFSEAIRAGRPLSASMTAEEKLYPTAIRTMVSTGEQTGEVEDMLANVSEALDEDVAALVEGLSAKIEVALLLLLGVVVGGLLVVLYMPILQLATTASKGMGME